MISSRHCYLGLRRVGDPLTRSHARRRRHPFPCAPGRSGGAPGWQPLPSPPGRAGEQRADRCLRARGSPREVVNGVAACRGADRESEPGLVPQEQQQQQLRRQRLPPG